MARSRNKSRDVELNFQGFIGGVDITTNPYKLPAFIASRVRNMVYDENGVLGRRGGMTQLATFGSASHRVLSLGEFRRAGESPVFVRHTSDGAVATSSDNGNTWTDRWTGLSTTAPFSYCTFNNMLFLANGTDDMRSISSSFALATYASAPDVKFLTAWKDSLWGTGELNNPFRVYSSAAGDGTTWPASQFIDIGKGSGGGGSNTGIAATADALVVFKEAEHWAIYDPVEFTNRFIDLEKGAVTHQSIVFHDGVMYFWSRKGICVYLGDAPAQIISDPLGAIWKYGFWSYPPIHGYNAGDHVGWAYVHGATRKQIEYYPRIRYGEEDTSPWLMSERPIVAPLGAYEVISGPDRHRMLAGHSAENSIQKFDHFSTVTDDGTAFTAFVQSAHLTFDAAKLLKLLKQVYVQYQGQSFDMALILDGAEGTEAVVINIPAALALDRNGEFLQTDTYFESICFKFRDVSGGAGGTDSQAVDGASVTTSPWTLIDFTAKVAMLGERY